MENVSRNSRCNRPVTLLLAFAATGFCQDQVDQAHRSIFQPPPSKQKAVGDITSTLAKQPAKRTPKKAERKNYIDQHIFGRMERNGVPYAGPAADEEFLRRAYLDATGRIP